MLINFREKSGYKYTFEHSIYINPDFISQGYGSIILKELIKVCRKNKKIKNLIAVIGGSNNICLNKNSRKKWLQIYWYNKKIGYKKNKWIDSVYMQKKL